MTIDVKETPLGLQFEFWFTPEPDGHCHVIGIETTASIYSFVFVELLRQATEKALAQHLGCQ